ncbi:MAG TPA: protein kinase [Pyrinomonadaceae bacterium]|nr:protein kinase [Pyrinomonadaceae bacterium]
MSGPGNNKTLESNSGDLPTAIAHYRILQRLGKGGMGEVFLAEDTKQHGRKVALKVLPPELTKDESRLRRFKQEARAILALNHPNILTIFEIGETDSTFYLATEFIEGETLRQCLWRSSLKIDQALGVAIQVAMALEAAHAAGIIHRDVKPENIMLRHDRLGRDRFVKVLDFGLAKLTERDTTSGDPEAVTMPIANTNPGAVIGTTGYMSPEQAQGETVDTRSDIFSLGVVLYEMVAGQAPFSGPTESHVRVSILDHDPAPLTQLSSETPRHLERIVSKALSKDKAKRYQTIADFKLDLEQLREELHFSQSGIVSRADEPLPLGGEALRTTLSRTQADTTKESTAPTVSSMEYIVNGVSRHKAAVITMIAVLGVIALATLYFYSSRRTIDSVAVLPIVNDSNDPNAEYLSDGITESIIRSLSQLPNLKVMSRSAVFRFKGKTSDPQEVGRTLKVGAVLSGRLVKQGDRFIIRTELIDVRDGRQLWGAEYNNNISDIFVVQDEISRKISETLRVRLSGEDAEKLGKRYTHDPEAYELYLRGRYFWNKRDEPGLRSGIKYFQQAQEKDPTFALAYSGLADSYALLSDIGAVKPADEMPKAKAAAQRAVDIDPALAEAYTSRAFVKLAYDWDWPGAEADFKQALNLNTKYPTAHQWYASYLMQMGKFGPAKEAIEKAHQLDPLSPIINSNQGLYAYYEHRYDDAIEYCNKTLEMVPDFWVAHHYRGLAYTMKGQHDQAIAELRQLIDSPGGGPLKEGAVENDPEVAASLAFAYAGAGKRAEAQAILARLKSLSAKRYVSPRYLAIVYTGLHDNAEAINQLNKAYESKHPGLVLIRIDPLFDRLRSDPGFIQLVKRFEPIP